MKETGLMKGHILASFTIVIWGTTFISTKLLLEALSPVEILFFRFLIGYLILWILKPMRLQVNRKQELLFIGAGFCGVTLYFLLENIALTYTLASNVGVIIAIAPFFTAQFAYFFLKNEKPKPCFYIGFLCAIIGIFLISFNGAALKLNPLGDLLAILAAIVWAMYSILTRKLSEYKYHVIPMTRRIFFYGLLLMMPALLFLDFDPCLSTFQNPVLLGNIIYLGFGASAICFVTWNCAVKILGAVKTSVYIYIVPVVTMVTSFLILKEPITPLAVFGMALTILGLGISEKNDKRG